MIYCQASVIYNGERLTFDISRSDKLVISLIENTFMIELEFDWVSFPLLHVNEQLIHMQRSHKSFANLVFLNVMEMSLKQFYPF